MEQNVGGYDRIARLVVGMVLLVGIAGFAVGSAGGMNLAVGPIPQAVAAAILLLAGAVLVVTGYPGSAGSADNSGSTRSAAGPRSGGLTFRA